MIREEKEWRTGRKKKKRRAAVVKNYEFPPKRKSRRKSKVKIQISDAAKWANVFHRHLG